MGAHAEEALVALESMIEKEARLYAESLGGKLLKFVSPNHKGVPDRIASHWVCGPFLMELKSPTKKLEEHQAIVCQDLADNGFRVYINVATIKRAKEIIFDEFTGSPKRHAPL